MDCEVTFLFNINIDYPGTTGETLNQGLVKSPVWSPWQMSHVDPTKLGDFNKLESWMDPREMNILGGLVDGLCGMEKQLVFHVPTSR